MSKIAAKPIKVPEGVEVKVEKEARRIVVKGKKGTLEVPYDPAYELIMKNGEIRIKRPGDEKEHKAKHGLYWKLLYNAIQGVTEGFKKELEIIGVGYRAQLKGGTLELSLGYSHPIYFIPPPEIKLSVESSKERTVVRVEGIDKALVGEVAAKIRALRKPNVYTGKGIRYVGEYVRRKPGKAAAKK